MDQDPEAPGGARPRAIPYSAWTVLAAVSGTLLWLAMRWGPRTCEGGTEDYLLAGIAALAVAFAAPVALARLAVWKRLALGLGFAVACLSVWIGGWVLGEFRLLCRLW